MDCDCPFLICTQPQAKYEPLSPSSNLVAKNETSRDVQLKGLSEIESFFAGFCGQYMLLLTGNRARHLEIG